MSGINISVKVRASSFEAASSLLSIKEARQPLLEPGLHKNTSRYSFTESEES
jgi:hypothetical protein